MPEGASVIFGPDLSHYQSGFDFNRAAAEGLQFVVGKISQGSTSHDTQWPKTRDQARAAGLIICGYHYVDGSHAADQAANCARNIGDKTTPVALDWEANGGNWSNLLNVLAAFRAAGLNVRLLYTGAWYWQQVGSPDMSKCGLALWKSRYPSTNPGAPAALYSKVPASYWAPLGGLETRLLQFTDHASIAGMNVDCSAFQGTRDELAALFGTTPPAPPVEDDMTDADRQLLAAIWSQLAGQDAKPGEFTGWPSNEGGSGKALTLVDYARQADVQLEDIKRRLDAIEGKQA
jgi:lysozyme